MPIDDGSSGSVILVRTVRQAMDKWPSEPSIADRTLDRVWPLLRLRPDTRGHTIVYAFDRRSIAARPRRIAAALPEECMAQRQEDLTALLTHFSEESVEAQPVPGLRAHGQADLGDVLDGGEIVLFALKPSNQGPAGRH